MLQYMGDVVADCIWQLLLRLLVDVIILCLISFMELFRVASFLQ